jgi:hypothetical protein
MLPSPYVVFDTLLVHSQSVMATVSDGHPTVYQLTYLSIAINLSSSSRNSALIMESSIKVLVSRSAYRLTLSFLVALQNDERERRCNQAEK